MPAMTDDLSIWPKKYHVYYSTAFYRYNKKENLYEWDEENEPDIMDRGYFDTLKEAYNFINNDHDGSRWIFYSAIFIESEKNGEEYSSIPALHKCECCGNEVWHRIDTDLRQMLKEDYE